MQCPLLAGNSRSKPRIMSALNLRLYASEGWQQSLRRVAAAPSAVLVPLLARPSAARRRPQNPPPLDIVSLILFRKVFKYSDHSPISALPQVFPIANWPHGQAETRSLPRSAVPYRIAGWRIGKSADCHDWQLPTQSGHSIFMYRRLTFIHSSLSVYVKPVSIFPGLNAFPHSRP